MTHGMRTRALTLFTAGAMALSSALAATPEEAAAQVAQAWATAIMADDVDAQMKLLPPKMYAKPGERERQRLQRLHDKEMAIVNNQKYVSFDVRAPVQKLKINKTIAVVVPYRSVQAVAEGKLQKDSVLIALSEEGSDQWSVFDGTGHGTRSLKMLIPGYSTGLNVPPAAVRLVKRE